MPKCTSKYKGVSRHPAFKKWVAILVDEGEIDVFDTEEEAARAYDEGAVRLFGAENCYMNFPEDWGYVTETLN